MEDRTTPGLYLELAGTDPLTFAEERAPGLLARPGVSRVTWWATSVPGRTELPMTVPDGTLLAVAETDGAFEPSPAPTGTTAAHFRRHGRPSQGILTGRPTTGLLVVWISPRSPELDRSLRDWGDFVHIRTIAEAAVPGFTQIAVYEGTTPGAPRYMHCYELDTDDPEGAYLNMARHVARHLGGSRTEAFARWADYDAPGGAVQYCNTFRLLGSADRP